MDDQKYPCAGCGENKPRSAFHEFRSPDRHRPVTSRCRDCRREDYYTARYETVCACCQKHRPLDSNQVCRKCNEESGLRECHGPCGKMLPLFLKYYGRSRKCKDCTKTSR